MSSLLLSFEFFLKKRGKNFPLLSGVFKNTNIFTNFKIKRILINPLFLKANYLFENSFTISQK